MCWTVVSGLAAISLFSSSIPSPSWHRGQLCCTNVDLICIFIYWYQTLKNIDFPCLMLQGTFTKLYLCQGGCLLLCQQDYTKATSQISTKLGWRTGLGPEVNALTLGADRDKGTDLGTFSHFLEHCKIGHFSTCCLISQGFKHGILMKKKSLHILVAVIYTWAKGKCHQFYLWIRPLK